MGARVLWLVRHGAPETPAGVAIGSSDPRLSPAGRAQARRLGARLASRRLTAVYTSDRLRAIETATEIGQPQGLTVQVDVRLRELDFGAWEKRNLADLWIEEASAAAAWERDLRATPPSFAEGLSQLETRVAEFWEDVRVSLRREVAVVAHRGSLAVLQALVTGTPLEALFATGLDLGAALPLVLPNGADVQGADRFQHS
jgi:broad specificity phosphatase PhoE